MNLAFDHPWVLVAALTALLPLLLRSQTPIVYPWTELIPKDPVSVFMDIFIRLSAAGVLVALSIGMAQPYSCEQSAEKIGSGAHVVLLLDRSASMNENFAGRYLGGHSNESKARTAQKLLSQFIKRRSSDLFAMVSFMLALTWYYFWTVAPA